jgi:methylthioribose-1-phosphate isomerase
MVESLKRFTDSTDLRINQFMNVTVRGRPQSCRTVAFDRARNAVLLIEQRLLPHAFKIVATKNFRATAAAIRDMTVRGAGAIGATSAYGLAQGARAFPGRDLARFRRHLETVYQTLKAARPTAVDPVNAMNDVRAAMRAGRTVAEQQLLALAAAEEFASADVRHCEAIGRHGARLIRNGMRILTHCNAGWLACVDWGTALAPIYRAHDAGIAVHVWVDETRPRNQGASLTAFELGAHGVPHTIVADNTGGHLMQKKLVDLCIVGTDRTTATGDVANKIGTYLKALAARDNHIPFLVALPFSTIDWSLEDGSAIPIEERGGDEVKFMTGKLKDSTIATVQIAPDGSPAANFGFDVTPARLITGFITERGVTPGTREGLATLYPEYAKKRPA